MFGIKDIDKLILLKIENEQDFISCMLLNKYVYTLYDECLFRNRVVERYGILSKPKNYSWRKLHKEIAHGAEIFHNYFTSIGVDYERFINSFTDLKKPCVAKEDDDFFKKSCEVIIGDLLDKMIKK